MAGQAAGAGGAGGGAGGAGGKPQNPMSQMMMFMVMPILLIMLFTPDIRVALGLGMDLCLGPSIGFGGAFPVYTIITTSIMMIIASTLLRHKYTDWISVGKQSYLQKYVQKKFKEAQGNPVKMKKVQELNAKIMRMTGDRMSAQMKTMMFTMMFSLILFMWLLLHMAAKATVHIASTPWALEEGWDLTDTGAIIYALTGGASKGPMPNWIILYSLFSLPVGQVLQAVLKFFHFRRRLDKLDRGEILTRDEEERLAEEKQAREEERKKRKEGKAVEGDDEDIDVVDGDFDVEEEDDLKVEDGDFEVSEEE